MTTSTTEYHGTNWRLVCGWADGGGPDGAWWDSALEWQDQAGSWHTAESWFGERKRPIPIPFTIQQWKVDQTARNCPAHKMEPIAMGCRNCQCMVRDMMAVK